MSTVRARSEFEVLQTLRAKEWPIARELAHQAERVGRTPAEVLAEATTLPGNSPTAVAAPSQAGYAKIASLEVELRALTQELGPAGPGRLGEVLERAVDRAGKLLVDAAARRAPSSIPEARAQTIQTLRLFGLPPGAFEIDARGNLRRDDESGTWRGYLTRSRHKPEELELALERGAPGDPVTRWESTLRRLERRQPWGDWGCSAEHTSDTSLEALAAVGGSPYTWGAPGNSRPRPEGADDFGWRTTRDLGHWTSLPDRLPKLTDLQIRALNKAGVARLLEPARLTSTDEKELLSTLHLRVVELEQLEVVVAAAEALPAEVEPDLTLPNLESALAESAAELTRAVAAARDRGMESGLPAVEAKIQAAVAKRILAPIEARLAAWKGAETRPTDPAWFSEQREIVASLVARLKAGAARGELGSDRAEATLAELDRVAGLPPAPAPSGAPTVGEVGGVEVDLARDTMRCIDALVALGKKASRAMPPSHSAAGDALGGVRRAVGDALLEVAHRAEAWARTAETPGRKNGFQVLADHAIGESIELDLRAADLQSDPKAERRFLDRAIRKAKDAGEATVGARLWRQVEVAERRRAALGA